MHKIKLYFGILLISVILLSGCAGMDGFEIKEQKAGMDKDDALFMRGISEKTQIR